ncbi:M56 family metallopeptidase [Planctomyces sp. SH-PL62]|uniref:M56 family metallopeptidase n=1 Tax=Planctomyces sp. SH-PL62 TaxID=1636152 RepID=UPI00078EDF6F|nr:M56 family metallopeptidase [Planctomyces sp. SH-PL62]AMV36209.1 Regulatory protein BlaR1 [Planctomyces sp. SH-PL62]
MTASFLASFERAATAWTETAWAVAWQSVLVVAAFAIVAAGLRRASPALRCWLWRIASFKLLLMPLWVVVWLSPPLPPQPTVSRPSAGPAVPASEDPAPDFGRRPPGLGLDPDRPAVASAPAAKGATSWRSALFAAWCLGVVAGVGALVGQGRRLALALERATPTSDARLLGLVEELAGRLGLRRVPGVVELDAATSPFVCGPRSPILVLPPRLADALEGEPLRAVLLHELEHLRRRDLLWDWLPALARVVYVVHPAARYVAYRALLERELACDRAAMDLAGQDAAAYASTLVEVVSLPSLRRFAIPAASAASPNPEE